MTCMHWMYHIVLSDFQVVNSHRNNLVPKQVIYCKKDYENLHLICQNKKIPIEH